jgi:hypothetical protein
MNPNAFFTILPESTPFQSNILVFVKNDGDFTDQ